MREYVHYPGIDQPHSMRTGSGTTYYYTTERPGHVTGLVTGSGTWQTQYKYMPWGEAEAASETVAQPLRYMARELDAATGLYYVRNRWYDPVLARFISEDPIGLSGGVNLYAYAWNDPSNLRDPLGLAPDEDPECVDAEHIKLHGTLCPLNVKGKSRPRGPTTGWTDNFGNRPTYPGERPECERDASGMCVLRHPSPNEWPQILVVINAIPTTHPYCAGARSELLNLYAMGRDSGGIMFWDGADLRRDDPTDPLRVTGQDFGYNGGRYLAFDSREFFRMATLPSHEALHMYFHRFPHPEYGDGGPELHREIYRVSRSCASRGR